MKPHAVEDDFPVSYDRYRPKAWKGALFLIAFALLTTANLALAIRGARNARRAWCRTKEALRRYLE